MTRQEALAILDLPRKQAEAAIVVLWEKAEHGATAQSATTQGAVSPTTPSGMQPVYLKPRPKRRAQKPGRKNGHPGARRARPTRIDAFVEHPPLSQCPHCQTALGEPIRHHTRLIEDIPQVTPEVTQHTIPGSWCGQCRKIVTPTVTEALPRASLGLRLVVYTAWLHYCVGVSVGNCVKVAAASLGLTVSPGGLTQAWKNLAARLEGDYDALLQKVRTSAVLHADETGWRLNGITCWLWAFATRQYCYYLIDPHRSSAVVKHVLGTLFPGILITDFWGAYNAIETLAKQKCYFHLFTELIKVDKLTTDRRWRRFRRKLSRLLKDAVRLGEMRLTLAPPRYERRKVKMHRRLDRLIATAWAHPHAKRLIKRLRRHRHEMLTFLDHQNVSPYNNHAEQQMRVAVHTRKVSQQNRSEAGAKTHAIFLSHFRTAQLQSLHPIDYLMRLAKTALLATATRAHPDTHTGIPLKKAA